MTNNLPDDWNPLDPEVLKDQRQAYDGMRQKCPVAHSEFLGWSLFRHDDVVKVLGDPQTFSNVAPFPAIPNGMDPPDHGRYRGALDPNFEPALLGRLEPQVRAIAATLLESLPRGEAVEFIHAFVTPFALKTLCSWLGWPEDQWRRLDGWVHAGQEAAFRKDAVAGKALAESFSQQVKANLADHRSQANRGADATDALLATEVDGRLDDDQIVRVLRNWAAGHGTVAGGLGIVVEHLARDPGWQARLRANPALIPAAIEEILRLDGPLVANARTTTREVELGGRSIPQGSHLTLMWMAANRDPPSLAEAGLPSPDPDAGASLVWGHGIHLCQGAPLARLELRIALEVLLAGTNHFEGAGEASREVYPSNGYASLVLKMA
jgi:cytochrome P450